MSRGKKTSDAPRYRKLFPMFWRDAGVRSLSAQEKLIAAYCLTSHQTNRIGLFAFSISLAAEDLGISAETFTKGFANVCTTLRWVFCNEGRVLFIPTWWKWNLPEGVNVMKGCLRDFIEVPESILCNEFATNEKYLTGSLLETFRERFRNLPETLPNSGAGSRKAGKQEQESIGGENGKTPKQSKFVPPTIAEVAAYCAERGNDIDAEEFVAHYASKGWVVGKSPMKNWKMSVVTWEKSAQRRTPASRVPTPEELEHWNPTTGIE